MRFGKAVTGLLARPFKTLSVGAALAVFLAGIEAPAYAQPGIADDSYSVYIYDDGGMQVQFAVWITPIGGTGSEVDITENYIPGVAVPAYTDCNCNAWPVQPESGYWDFSYSWEGQDGQDWYVGLTWVLYSPSVSFDSCEGCPNCEDPENENLYISYYATLQDECEIVNY